jgi:hypothetical protein
VEAQLDNTLLAMVGGARRSATLNQVREALSRDYQLEADAVQVRRFHAEGFLLVFHDWAVVDRVLHAEPPEGAVLHLIFRRWHRQLGALFSPMFFKVCGSCSDDRRVLVLDLRRVAGLGRWIGHVAVPGGGLGGASELDSQ